MDHLYKNIQYHINNFKSKGNSEITLLFIKSSNTIYDTFQMYFEEMNAVTKSDINRRIKINVLRSIYLTFNDLFIDFKEMSNILGDVVYNTEISSYIDSVLDTKYKRCLSKI